MLADSHERARADPASPERPRTSYSTRVTRGEYRWRLPELLGGTTRKVTGEKFTVGGFEWRASLYPHGCEKRYEHFVSVFLQLLTPGKEARASYEFRIERERAPKAAWAADADVDAGAEGEATSNLERRAADAGEGVPALVTRAAGPRVFGTPAPAPAVPPTLLKPHASSGGSAGAAVHASWGFPTFCLRRVLERAGVRPGEPLVLIVLVSISQNVMSIL
mmetsp:Transcript_9630/g.31572  ORF Transcript_9630/g.31572 Transcript_9630/m.31572 type:complete len:220 (-) Transcript_9630:3029-3688(-)